MRHQHLTIVEALQYWARHDPTTPAFIFVDVTWRRRVLSRADVYRLASRYAAILRRQGIRQGDVVSNTLPNSPERLISDLGIVLAGAAAMNGQIVLADGEDFIGSLRNSGCCAVILDPLDCRGAAAVLEARVHSQEGTHVHYPDLPNLHQLFLCHWDTDGEHQSFMDVLEAEQETFVADVTPDDVADVWTTSGSTGFSKLVPRTHDGVLSFGHAFVTSMGLQPGHPFYNDRSLGWSGGFPGSFLSHGTTRVLPDLSRGLPEDSVAFTWDLICRERVTVAFFVPAQLLQIIDYCDKLQQADLWKLHIIGSGAQPCRKRHMEAIGKITDSVRVCYGSCEAGAISFKVVTDKDAYEDCNNGNALEGMEMKIVDDDLQDVPQGQMGEIVVRGTQLFKHYLNNQAATQKAFTPDGWFRTGDVGHINVKGEVFTICRKSYSIMRGPYLLYPGWLEDRISRCPGVEDVMVVPVPDPLIYEELCACLIPQPGASLTPEGVKEFCKKFVPDVRKIGENGGAQVLLVLPAVPHNQHGQDMSPLHHQTCSTAPRSGLGSFDISL